SLNKLASTSRTYAFNYNKYEDTDLYETIIHVEVPKGKNLVELPSNETFSFGKMTYSLTYTLAPGGELKVIRKFASDRNEIAAKDYLAFRTFVEKIVKAEQRMIAFQ
ncbi:MAG TPA: hypothetical protein VFD46_12900, partial [Chryseolinea sp.]|nr:hypothetical protein [Chryseolinea sp.]